jgi:hypothetical protein
MTRIVLLIIVPFFVYGCEFERIGVRDFEIGTTFIAGDCFTRFDVVHIDIYGVVAFRANDWHTSFSCYDERRVVKLRIQAGPTYEYDSSRYPAVFERLS